MAVAEKCRYDGPEIGSLPEPISNAIAEMMSKLPSEARLRVIMWKDSDNFLTLPDKRTIDPNDYRVFFASDSSGLAQACLNHGNSYYRVLVRGATQEERERIMGYDKSRLEVLAKPDRVSVWDPGWIIEGEPKNKSIF